MIERMEKYMTRRRRRRTIVEISPTAQYANFIHSIEITSTSTTSTTKKKKKKHGAFAKQNNNNNNNNSNGNDNHDDDDCVDIMITIQSNCSRPYYVARLVGPSIVGMRRMHHFHTNGSKIDHSTYREDNQQLQFQYEDDTITRNGTKTEILMYPIPISGVYNIEILQLICNYDKIMDIGRHCLPNTTETLLLNKNPLEMYFEKTFQQEGNDNTIPGFWIHQNFNNDHDNDHSSEKKDLIITNNNNNNNNHTTIIETLKPLQTAVATTKVMLTRYQRQNDNNDKNNNNNNVCIYGNQNICDRSWFENYEFVGQDVSFFMSSSSKIQQKQQKSQNHQQFHHRNLCFYGKSHGREMTYAFQNLSAMLHNNNNNDNNNNDDDHNNNYYLYRAFFVEASRLPSQFLDTVWMTKLQADLVQYNCTDMIIAHGQWPLTYGNRHVDANTWISQISKIVDYFYYNYSSTNSNNSDNNSTNNNNNNGKRHLNIILRSIHPIPLGYTRLSCPPTDFRNPYLIESYNEKLRELYDRHPAFQKQEKHHRNLFIDTNAIIGPIWDLHSDFNHLTLKEGIPEAIYILNEMIRINNNDNDNNNNKIHNNNDSNNNNNNTRGPNNILLVTSATWMVIMYFYCFGRWLRKLS